MAARMKRTSPGTRLELGATVLAGARGADTSPVEDRLRRFEQAHRSYVAAQRKVDAAEEQIRAAQSGVAQLSGVANEAIEALACALAMNGQPRKKPFEAFGVAGPGRLIHERPPQKAVTVHQLVAAVLRHKGTNDATKLAVEGLEKAAHELEEALPPVEKLQAAARDARGTRDAIGQKWESALTDLRRGTLAASEELYTMLFQPGTKPAKTKSAEEVRAEALTPNAA
jgi:hypothetical protein